MNALPTISQAVEIANVLMKGDSAIASVDVRFASLRGEMIATIYRDGRLEVK